MWTSLESNTVPFGGETLATHPEFLSWLFSHIGVGCIKIIFDPLRSTVTCRLKAQDALPLYLLLKEMDLKSLQVERQHLFNDSIVATGGVP